jgi:hypothetical protein
MYYKMVDSMLLRSYILRVWFPLRNQTKQSGPFLREGVIIKVGGESQMKTLASLFPINLIGVF